MKPAPSVMVQMVALIGLSALLALAAQYTMPRRIPWSQDWERAVMDKAQASGIQVASLDEVQDITRQMTHIILDARSTADYLEGHLPGAFSLPDSEMEAYLPGVLPLLSPEQPVLVYCSGKACDESLQLGMKLKEQGFTNLLLFAGGILEWNAAGLPLQQ